MQWDFYGAGHMYGRNWSNVKIEDKDASIRIRAKIGLIVRLFTVKGPWNAPCDYVSNICTKFSLITRATTCGYSYIMAAQGFPLHSPSFCFIKTVNIIYGWFIRHFCEFNIVILLAQLTHLPVSTQLNFYLEGAVSMRVCACTSR